MPSKRKKRVAKKKKAQLRRITGTLSVARAGFGFVKPISGAEDIFIPKRYIGDAIDGDIVRIEFIEGEPPRPPFKNSAAKIVSIVERKRKTVVGELIPGKKLRPISSGLTEDIFIQGNIGGANKGDWIEITLPDIGKKSSKRLSGTISSVIGKVGNVRDDLEAIRREFRIPEPYSEEQSKRALELPHVELERLDFTEHVVLTIDPDDAKDFDDAISIEIDGKIATLGIHIADISAWIMPGSEFDIEAYERAFTSYLPGMTLPMLPRSFTRSRSLNEGEISFASSLFIKIDNRTGEVISSQRARTIIKVTQRLTFDQVQDFIDGKKPGLFSKKVNAKLDELVKLTRKMREFRKKTENFLLLETVSARVVFDKTETEIVGIRIEKQREAEQLVEECMLAANVEVAKELAQKGLPGLFRVHSPPNPEKLAEFTDFMRSTFSINCGDLSSRISCNNFLSNLPDDHRKQIICDAFLRSLPRAEYSEKPSEHFGLGKGLYSHFTSPIRRYPDLAVHQQLLAYDLGLKTRSKADFAVIAAECSAKEENNDQAYYAANDRMKLHYLRKLMNESSDEVYEGIIQKISGHGILVNVPVLGLCGFIQREKLHGAFHRRAGKIRADRGHKSFRCGDFIYIRIAGIDIPRGTAYFSPV